MKVVTAMIAAWLLRCAYMFGWADKIESWAGIDYDPDDEFKWGGTD